jgi:cell wall-associated NlpC family hydrolase
VSLGQLFKAAVALVVVCVAGLAWAITQLPSSVAAQPDSAAARVVAAAASTNGGPLPAARPHVVEPTAGITDQSGPSVPDISPASPSPSTVSATLPPNPLPQPVSDATIRQELRAGGIAANPNQAALTSNLLAVAPIAAPLAVQQVIQAGNEIAKLPYVWGGGHGTYADTGYDCSGSISYVFAAAHLLSTTLVSGELANWGLPGPGKWITVFANAGHTFMYVAGLRFDTVALAETGSRWSQRTADESNLGSFAIRHPAGL